MPEGVTPQQWTMLGVLGATYLVNSYDLGVFNLALPQIQQSFALSEADVGKLPAIVRLGVLPALALNVLADRVGRRRLLLLTIVGFTVCTFLTSFVRSAAEFAVLQFLARMFIYTEEILAMVVVTETLAPAARGWGIGLMVAFGALGHGLSALVFSAVEILPYGWRALYLVGVLPLLLIAWLRRSLEETERFRASAERRRAHLESHLAPLQALLARYPWRLAALCAAILPMAFANGAAIQFLPKFLQEAHGYTPAEVSALFLLGGPIAMTGGLLFGRASDRFGRVYVLAAAITAHALALVAFYNSSGIALPLAWIVAIFTVFGIDVLFSALGSELFATAYRSTASGVRSIVWTVSGAASLFVEGTLYTALGGHAQAITMMAWSALLSPVVLLTMVPETARRELEEIAPDED